MTEPTVFAIVSADFEELYVREYPGLIAVATALSGYDGEDLVQDAMVRALVNWDKVGRLERPGMLVPPSAGQPVPSRWRRLLTEARFLARLRRDEPSTDAPSDDVMSVWSAVRELPERQRLAVALCAKPAPHCDARRQPTELIVCEPLAAANRSFVPRSELVLPSSSSLSVWWC